MAKLETGSNFLSGFGNENILEEFYTANGERLEPSSVFSENEEHFKIEIGVPFIEEDDLSFSFDGHRMKITGSHEITNDSEDTKRVYKATIQVPDDISKKDVRLAFKDGLLHVILPKEKIHSKQQHLDER